MASSYCAFDDDVDIIHFPESETDGGDYRRMPCNSDQKVLSLHDGVPGDVKELHVSFFELDEEDRDGFERELCHLFTCVNTLLDNTPRKIGSIKFNFEVCDRHLVSWSAEFRDFFASVCSKTEQLEYDFIGAQQEIETFGNFISTQQDAIKKLYLTFSNSRPNLFSTQHLRQIFQMKSLEKLRLRDINIDPTYGNSEMIASLEVNRTSLRELYISVRRRLDDDVLLKRVFCAVADHTHVEELTLYANLETEFHVDDEQEGGNFNEATRLFLDKLASAKNLRTLRLGYWALPRTDGVYLQSFADAVSRNQYLESLTLHWKYGDVSKVAWQARHQDKIGHHLCMNRAARGLDRDPSTPAGLWPHVLQRAGRIRYYDRRVGERWWDHESTSERRRADVIFELLRGRAVPFFN